MKKVKQVFEIAWKTGVIVLALCSIAVVGIVVYALNKERSVPGHHSREMDGRNSKRQTEAHRSERLHARESWPESDFNQ